MLATEVIKTKRSGSQLTQEQIDYFINGYTQGDIPDYQMASLLMAIFLNGMEDKETIHLTQSMLDSGTKVEFDDFLAVDKHSTGGVGDKTSLILAPIVAACGVPVPMMSGRGLGHTGGTLDKLESIPGFNVNLDLPTFKKQVSSHLLSFIGQTENICPADKKIYALRDVTGTVESLPLICASIMSKKIAEGIKGLVLDVKMGSGAFMKSLDEAKALANGLISIGKGHGINTQAMITDMDQPLGRFVGNSLEVGECISILKREDFMGRRYSDFADTEELSLVLSAKMIAIGLNCGESEAMEKATEVLNNGRAFEKFEEICRMQNGDLNSLPMPDQKVEVTAKAEGYLNSIDSEKIGIAGISVAAGRRLITDEINPVTGIEIHKKLGEPVKKGEALFSLHFNKSTKSHEQAVEILNDCYRISGTGVPPRPLIVENL